MAIDFPFAIKELKIVIIKEMMLRFNYHFVELKNTIKERKNKA
jgi:hypothetical protein